MLPKSWFLHIDGETIGPLAETSVSALLHTKRLHFSDFGWSEGMRHWARLSDLLPFSKQMPELPGVGLPSKATAGLGHQTAPGSRTATTHAHAAPLQLVRQTPAVEPKTTKTPPGGIQRPERVALDGMVIFEDRTRHKILNLSESGVFIRLPEDIPILGTEIRFTLQAKALGKVLEMTGILIREEMNEGENAVAIEFTKVNPVHRRILRGYVDSKLSAK